LHNAKWAGGVRIQDVIGLPTRHMNITTIKAARAAGGSSPVFAARTHAHKSALSFTTDTHTHSRGIMSTMYLVPPGCV